MKVFLVEDSQVIIGYLRSMIAEVAGGEVIAEADSQDDAVQGIRDKKPDVVILDLSLAKGRGIEVLRRVRPLFPAMTMIVLTNRSEPPYRRKCIALGADHFLDKSRDLENLGRHLAALAGGRA